MNSEWDPRCQFSKYIHPHFSNREDLNPNIASPDVAKIESVFHNVRGKWSLWQAPREQADWTRVETELPLHWGERNVEILYPSEDRFPVTELNGVVFWDEGPSEGRKRFQLYEGNHRFSTWVAERTPDRLPAVIFVGKPKDPVLA